MNNDFENHEMPFAIKCNCESCRVRTYREVKRVLNEADGVLEVIHHSAPWHKFWEFEARVIRDVYKYVVVASDTKEHYRISVYRDLPEVSKLVMEVYVEDSNKIEKVLEETLNNIQSNCIFI